MKRTTFGIAVIILGIIMFGYAGRGMSHSVKWSPVVGVVLFLGGIIVVAQGKLGKRLNSNPWGNNV